MLKNTIKLIRFCNKNDRKKYLLSFAFCLVGALSSVLKILALFVVCSCVVKNGAAVTDIMGVILLVLGTIVLQLLSNRFMAVFQTDAATGLMMDARTKLAVHLRKVPLIKFNPFKSNPVDIKLNEEPSYIKNITVNTVSELGDLAAVSILGAYYDIVCNIIMILIICFLDYTTGIIILCGMILYGSMNLTEEKIIKKRMEKNRFDNKNLDEAINGFCDKVSGENTSATIEKAGEKLYDAIDLKKNSDIGKMTSDMPFDGLAKLFLKISVVCVLGYVINVYLHGGISSVMAVLLIVCSLGAVSGLHSPNKFKPLLEKISEDIDKVKEVLAAEETDADGDDFKVSKRNISIENLSCAGVENMNMKIAEGGEATISGSLDGGEAMFSYVLSGFCDDYDGEVYLDGKNIKTFSKNSLISNYDFIWDNAYVFNDTIANNIKLYDNSLDDETVHLAAKKSGCHDFITGLPGGYESVVGKDVFLTDAEAKKIAIARAILRNAPIITVDNGVIEKYKNDKEYMAGYRELTRDKTLILLKKANHLILE